ncbi:MAG: hypothetical protein K2X08_04140 [Chlamydiales bacterium]|nr:hypothetical protein [Chlamydiales bacterium]MBY0529920.1 hypothetical protein [Rhabdochlamydiaceae bacterium]
MNQKYVLVFYKVLSWTCCIIGAGLTGYLLAGTIGAVIGSTLGVGIGQLLRKKIVNDLA